MALSPLKQTSGYFNKLPVLLILIAGLGLQSCSRNKRVFQSDCDASQSFKHIGFKDLIDSLDAYDQKYVEVSGIYEEDKELSILVNNSAGVKRSNQSALWVNFSQDCPLYLSGTHIGLFEYNDGQFTQINDKSVTIRGKLDTHNNGPFKHYKATIDRVSYIKL